MTEGIFDLESVRLRDEDSKLVILDQTLLPNKVEYADLQPPEEVWNAIYRLQVRGAPAIGVAAGYGAYLGAKAIKTDDYTYFLNEFKKIKEYLASSRPTAVNLFWALNRMEDCITKNKSKRVAEIKELLRMEADNIKAEDIEICKSIGKTGAALLKDGMGILTHCNAGTLATSKYGTALSPVYMAIEQRGFKNLKVFCDETRPLLQGARLTAFELMQAGVDTTLICDNMASMVMKNGWVQAVFVGCDRVAANGDTANKIGTSGVAILAAHYGIPFYVCGPTSTIDLNTATGGDIKIELRKPEEVTEMWYKERMAPEGVGVYNPAFDVTDNSLITGIITEYGMAKAPYIKSLKEIMEKNGKNS